MADIVSIDSDDGLTMEYMHEYREHNFYGYPHLAAVWSLHTRDPFVGSTADPTQVHPSVRRTSVDFVTASGHGTWKRFLGYGNVVLFDADSLDPQHADAKIVHLFGCQAGACLGLEFVRQGAKAFWGYTVDFAFPVTVPYPPRGQRHVDPKAVPFLELDNVIDTGILTGRTASQIYQEMENHFALAYGSLLQGHQDLLLEDFAHLAWPGRPWGDETATL